MNGGHDLGGMHGLGPINPESESEEPVFHSEWERRVFAMTVASGMLGQWNIDMGRYARERQNPADYIKNSYYENWLVGLEKLLVEKNLITAEELKTGKAIPGVDTKSDLTIPGVQDVPGILAKGGPSIRPSDDEPAYGPGVPVKVININTSGHTRAPRYVRGHRGKVASYLGFHVFPDRAAHGPDEGAHLYSVWFTAGELWGKRGFEKDGVFVDLWEPHLEPAIWQG
jgi:nitrile hydratase beta subunit